MAPPDFPPYGVWIIVIGLPIVILTGSACWMMVDTIYDRYWHPIVRSRIVKSQESLPPYPEEPPIYSV